MAALLEHERYELVLNVARDASLPNRVAPSAAATSTVAFACSISETTAMWPEAAATARGIVPAELAVSTAAPARAIAVAADPLLAAMILFLNRFLDFN